MKHLRILAVLAIALVAGCGWWTDKKTAATEHAAAEIARCAFEAYAEDPSISAEKLAARCGPLAIEEAAKILVAVKKVGVRLAAPPCPSFSAPAPSIKPSASASASK